jgi:deazaflavin-dependent oxidoreductase (nitroreductase family)
MPSDLTLKAMNAVHRAALMVTRGRIGWTVSNMPALELTTTGRRSGQPRTVMLTSPLQEGSTLVVVASRGGDDTAPLWYLNLCANPAVDVSFQGAPAVRMHARVASAEERARLWPLVIADHTNYADYQTKTQREIPLVLLDPQVD